MGRSSVAGQGGVPGRCGRAPLPGSGAHGPAGRRSVLGVTIDLLGIGGAPPGDVVDGVHAGEGCGAFGGAGCVDPREAGGEGRVGGAPDVSAVGGEHDQPAGFPAQDEAVVVDEAMVGVAEQDEVGQLGAPAEQPVPHVMGMEAFDAGFGAAGPGASAVAAQQCPALRFRGAPPAATDGERFPTLLQHDHRGGLAEHAAGLGAGDRRPALEVRPAGGRVVGQHLRVDVHHDLAPGWIPGAAIHGHAGLGECAEGGDAPGGGALAGESDGCVVGAALGHRVVHPAAGLAGHLVRGPSLRILGALAAEVPLGEGVDRGQQGARRPRAAF